MKKEKAEKEKAEKKPPVAIRRLRKRREIARGSRVKTGRGDGEFQYFDIDRKMAVVTLDKPVTDAATGFVHRNVFIDIDEIEEKGND
jgi:hypothetical protein